MDGDCSIAANSCDLEVGLQTVPFHSLGQLWLSVISCQLSVVSYQRLVFICILWILQGYALQDDKVLIINHNEQLSPWRENRPIGSIEVATVSL